MVPILEVSLALAFFVNKAFLITGKRIGWFVGFVAALFSVVYYLNLELYVFTVYGGGFAILTWHGFRTKGTRSTQVAMRLRWVTTTIMGVLACFTFSGLMTVVELAAALLGLWGAYFLTGEYVRVGWMAWSVGHVLTWLLFAEKGQDFFAHFQLASAIIAVAGAYKGGNSVIESSA